MSKDIRRRYPNLFRSVKLSDCLRTEISEHRIQRFSAWIPTSDYGKVQKRDK